MQIDVFTLFPQWFAWFETQRHVANALAQGHELRYVSYRDHTPLSAGQVDDTPFGGGAGMVLRVDVVDAALRAHYGRDPVELREERRIVALAAGGRVLDDALLDELAAEPALTLLCGRYEGFDQRVVEHLASDAVSIGRYVLSGGELAAMVLCDAVLRKLPGALGHEESAVEESFSAALEGLPEYPHYTRPAEYRGWAVPEVLLSGHHERVREWRRAEARRRAGETVRARIVALEHELMAAVQARDIERLEGLLAPAFTLTTGRPGTEVRTREEWLAITGERYVIESFAFEQLEVDVYDDAAVARSRYRQAGSMDGADRTQPFLMTDTWVRRRGRWQLATRHITPLPGAAGGEGGPLR